MICDFCKLEKLGLRGKHSLTITIYVNGELVFDNAKQVLFVNHFTLRLGTSVHLVI